MIMMTVHTVCCVYAHQLEMNFHFTQHTRFHLKYIQCPKYYALDAQKSTKE